MITYTTHNYLTMQFYSIRLIKQVSSSIMMIRSLWDKISSSWNQEPPGLFSGLNGYKLPAGWRGLLQVEGWKPTRALAQIGRTAAPEVSHQGWRRWGKAALDHLGQTTALPANRPSWTRWRNLILIGRPSDQLVRFPRSGMGNLTTAQPVRITPGTRKVTSASLFPQGFECCSCFFARLWLIKSKLWNVFPHSEELYLVFVLCKHWPLSNEIGRVCWLVRIGGPPDARHKARHFAKLVEIQKDVCRNI